MPADTCAMATVVAFETVMNECNDRQGRVEMIDDDTFVFVPEGVPEEEFGASLDSPQTEAERQEAIESCMEGEWSAGIAEGFFGPDPPPEAVEAFKQRVCTGLLS